MTNRIYCDECQTAYITTKTDKEGYYVCEMCRDYYDLYKETKLQKNTIKDKDIIEYFS